VVEGALKNVFLSQRGVSEELFGISRVVRVEIRRREFRV
jgi:hypothetical protein